jgi:hypothetical protein
MILILYIKYNYKYNNDLYYKMPLLNKYNNMIILIIPYHNVLFI